MFVFYLLFLVASNDQPLHIRHIIINNLSVFDPTHQEFRWLGFRVANRFHATTRESFIRNELLFSEGDLLQPDLLRESERNLRRYTFLTEVSIKQLRVSDREVDLLVNTEDQWTLKPSFSWGKTRATRTVTVGIEDQNFLGLGRTLGIQFDKDVEREGFSAHYADPRFLNHRMNLNLHYSNLSDGHRLNYLLNQPFYSQDSRWSYGVQGADSIHLQHFYYKGIDAASVEDVERAANFDIVRAWGERYQRDRFGVRLGYSGSQFPSSYIYDEDAAQRKEIQKNLNPEDKELFNVGLNFVRDRQQFARFYYVDNFGRTEDLPYGTLTGFSIVHSTNEAGHDFVTPSITSRFSFHHGNAQYFVAKSGVSIRREDGSWNNFYLDTSARYYNQNGPKRLGFFRSPKQTLAVNVAATWTSHMDAPFQLSLGEDEGLRGYPFREFTGQNRALLNLEYRILLPIENHFMGIAIVPFADAGYAWIPEYNFGTSIGIGMRIGFKKYGRTRVLRIDYAWPLVNGNHGSVSISAGQAFDIL